MSEKTGHTAGPWHAFPPINLVEASSNAVIVRGVGWEIHDRLAFTDESGARIGDTPNMVALVTHPYPATEQGPNARLIAAAPDMLAALVAAETHYTMICEAICADNPPPGGLPVLEQLRAAIKKARGE